MFYATVFLFFSFSLSDTFMLRFYCIVHQDDPSGQFFYWRFCPPPFFFTVSHSVILVYRLLCLLIFQAYN